MIWIVYIMITILLWECRCWQCPIDNRRSPLPKCEGLDNFVIYLWECSHIWRVKVQIWSGNIYQYPNMKRLTWLLPQKMIYPITNIIVIVKASMFQVVIILPYLLPQFISCEFGNINMWEITRQMNNNSDGMIIASIIIFGSPRPLKIICPYQDPPD